MKVIKAAIATVIPAVIIACDHPIQIQGQGDVLSGSGNRDCYMEDFIAGKNNCAKNTVILEYQETYFAQPRTGWEFLRWGNYCEETPDNQCSFSAKAGDVFQFWGLVAPPLIAVFGESSDSNPNRGDARLLVVASNDPTNGDIFTVTWEFPAGFQYDLWGFVGGATQWRHLLGTDEETDQGTPIFARNEVGDTYCFLMTAVSPGVDASTWPPDGTISRQDLSGNEPPCDGQ